MKGTKISTLGFAILGLLVGSSMSGYDLKLQMAGSVGYFWQARHSQIYPELSRLEEAGLVTHQDVAQEGRPDKKMYEATDSGIEAVAEWVSLPAKVGPTRDEATVKAYLSWLGDPEKLLENFRKLAQAHEEQMSRYQEIEARLRRGWGEDVMQDPKKFASYAALKRGIGYEREYIEWCRWVIQNFERMAERNSR